ncbi:MAG: 3-carboxy-cis,cis-muconate cycloisomerase [Gammaproteobacteria bacterium]
MAIAHRDTVMIGRTNGQHAQPTTFGARIAQWLEAFMRHQSRLAFAGDDASTIQLGGMVGSLASVHPNGLEMRERMASRLGLNLIATNWHNSRDSIAAVAQVLGLICASLARIARDIAALGSTDIAEVYEKGK